MAPNGLKRLQMPLNCSNGSKWLELAQNRSELIKMAPSSSKWLQMTPIRSKLLVFFMSLNSFVIQRYNQTARDELQIYYVQ